VGWPQDMELRAARQQLEFVWRGSRSFGADADVFTGNFASGNYGPPPGFNWDWGQADPQIQVMERRWMDRTANCARLRIDRMAG
jgi:hypothetical protein